MPPVGASLQVAYDIRFRQAVNKSFTWRIRGVAGRSLGIVYDLANEPQPSLVLTLDTTPPVVTFGAPVETWDRLEVPYEVNEQAVESAWFTDADGNQHDMVVLADRLVLNLAAVVDGEGTVTARARDDVWNQADYTLAVTIEGLPAPQDPGTGLPGVPSRPPTARRRRTTEHRQIATTVRVRVHTTTTVRRSTVQSRVLLRAASSDVLRVRHSPTFARVGVASSGRSAAAIPEILRAPLTVTDEVQRRDGPGLEEAIIMGLI